MGQSPAPAGFAMSVKQMNSLRSTVAALALAFLACLALSPPVAGEPVMPQQVAALSQTPAAPRALSPAAQHFLAAVRANFAQWDLNHDGVLTRDEIDLDLQNPHIVDEAAAAL